MHSSEPQISPQSNYYVYAPSTLAKKLYLYPICLGYFYYEPHYSLSRTRFDSFLLMYITKGSCTVHTSSCHDIAHSGQVVLLDCYSPHQYSSSENWEAAWIHFDGPLATSYYNEITSKYGNILSPSNVQGILYNWQKIYNIFHYRAAIEESKLSKYITHMVDGLLFPQNEHSKNQQNALLIADSMTYINDNFSTSISLELLSKQANLSLYHFSRLFTKETGYTPHQYILLTRITAAKYLLNASDSSIKDIAFSTGFHSESSFCTTFKKWEQVTPSQYRERLLS